MIHDVKAILKPTRFLDAKPAANKPFELLNPAKKLAIGMFMPHLERMLTSCANCGFLGFKVTVSPLLGQHKGAAVIQKLECVRCGAVVPVEDGIFHGRRPNPHKPVRRIK